jgi:hypothetical protein
MLYKNIVWSKCKLCESIRVSVMNYMWWLLPVIATAANALEIKTFQGVTAQQNKDCTSRYDQRHLIHVPCKASGLWRTSGWIRWHVRLVSAHILNPHETCCVPLVMKWVIAFKYWCHWLIHRMKYKWLEEVRKTFRRGNTNKNNWLSSILSIHNNIHTKNFIYAGMIQEVLSSNLGQDISYTD